MHQAQNPDELFDVVTEDGEPTGITKSRADVHRNGDWHRAVHIWVYGCNERGPYLLMNQRGKQKDTWPLALDATVGGHLGAGETVEDAFREVHEEIGVNIDPARFEWLFQRKRSSGELIPGVLDQEIQEVFIVHDDRPLTAFAPNPAELEGIVVVSVADAVQLFRGEVESAAGSVLLASTGGIQPHTLTSEQLLVRGSDRYFIDVIEAVEQRTS